MSDLEGRSIGGLVVVRLLVVRLVVVRLVVVGGGEVGGGEVGGGEVGGELELDGLAPSRQLLPRKWCLGGERGGAGARSRDHHEEVSRWGGGDHG